MLRAVQVFSERAAICKDFIRVLAFRKVNLIVYEFLQNTSYPYDLLLRSLGKLTSKPFSRPH